MARLASSTMLATPGSVTAPSPVDSSTRATPRPRLPSNWMNRMCFNPSGSCPCRARHYLATVITGDLARPSSIMLLASTARACSNVLLKGGSDVGRKDEEAAVPAVVRRTDQGPLHPPQLDEEPGYPGRQFRRTSGDRHLQHLL